MPLITNRPYFVQLINYPTIEQIKLKGGNSNGFGYSVSFSGDGNTILVGANQDDDGGTDKGAAYVYTKSSGSPLWPEQEKLIASDGQNSDEFGFSVSLSTDGNIALIGAPGEDDSGSSSGAAYIFRRGGSPVTWSQQQRIKASNAGSGDVFGWSSALSADGTTAIIGAYSEDDGGSTSGAAYVFTNAGGSPLWVEQQKLKNDIPDSGARFGWSVSISSDGNTAIVGEPREDGSGTNSGAAYIFTRSGSVWSQYQKLTASDAGSQDQFGWSVSISSDGNTAIIGANLEDGIGSDRGAAYVFTKSGSPEVWSQQQKLTSSDAENDDWFGYSVSLSSDGTTAIVGAMLENGVGAVGEGAAYIFTRSGSPDIWTEQIKLVASDAIPDYRFANSVSISGDGKTAVVGAEFQSGGSAYVYI